MHPGSAFCHLCLVWYWFIGRTFAVPPIKNQIKIELYASSYQARRERMRPGLILLLVANAIISNC
jgi:hypothetical protein